ncbi:MAG: thiamine phosphate synthase [Bacteroidia bacterium]
MKIIIITPNKILENETLLVTELFQNGLQTLHLKKINSSTAEVRAYLDAIPKTFHPNIVLHSHHRLATSFAIQGLHISRAHRKNTMRQRLREMWLKMRRSNLSFSRSYYKLLQLHEDKQKFEYVFLSPVFDRLTHDFAAGFNAATLRVALEKCKTPVVARGHIEIDKIPILHGLGFKGIAIQQTIWDSPDPVSTFLEFEERIRELKTTQTAKELAHA